MHLKNLQQQIEFIKEIDKIKYIQRKTKLFNSNRFENDAEHSWHLAVMAIILNEHSNKSIDILKVIKMLLIHDIVEIDSGDIFIYDTEKNHTNTDEELKASKRIFGILPKVQAKELINLWIEFEAGKTEDAKFAKALDRFEPILQNISNDGGTWNEYKVSKESVIDKTKPIMDGSVTIWEHSERLINNYYKNNDSI